MTFWNTVRMRFRTCPQAPGIEDIGPVEKCPYCSAPAREHLSNAEILADAHEDTARFHERVAAKMRAKAR